MPRPKHRNGFLTLAVLAALWVVVLGAVSLLRKVDSFQPAGFAAHAEGATWLVDDVSSPATGLEPGDRLVLVNGTEARSARDLRSVLRQNPTSALLVERAGVPLEVSYRRPALAIDWHYLILALIGIGYLFIGFYTLLRDQRRAARLFYLWCLTSGLVYVASAQPPFDLAGRLVYTFEELARVLLAPLTLHLFLVFPRPLARLRDRLGWLPFLYVPAAFLALLEADLIFAGGRFLLQGQMAAATRALDQLVLFQLVGFGLAAAVVLIWRLRRRRDSEPLRQAAWIAFGMLGGYVPFLLFYLLPRTLDLAWPKLLTTAAVLPLACVPLTFAYAILRYKLWDIGIVIRDTLSLATTVLIGVLGFSLVNLVIQRAVPEGLAFGRTIISFTSGLLIAGLMIPTRQRIGASLERLQYGGAFRRRRGLVEFGREMLEERDLDKLSNALLGELAATFDLGRANLYLGESERLLVQRAEAGVPARLRVSELDEDFWASDVRSLTGPALPSEVDASYRLYTAGYRYAFPLTARRRRIGVLVIGYKRGDVALSSADIDLVRNLLGQVSLAIDNAYLLGQVNEQLDRVSKLQETTAEILESSPAGIAVIAGDGTIDRANAALGRILETAPEALVGRSLAELLGQGSLPRPNDRLREIRFASPAGREHYLQVSVAPLASGHGGSCVVLVHDVTERIAIENAMKERERLASLGMLAAGVAHEVNTPITGISSYAQMLLQSTPEDDPRHELLRKVERQTFRASRIVNNLLEFSRDRPRESRPVSLAFVVGECLDLLKERLRESHVELDWRPPAEELRVWGNDGELLQVFTNLVVNAADAMAAGGRLTVSFDASEDWIKVGVEDTGPGIPVDQLERIFRPFFSTKLPEGGTGLGLSISYNIVQRHGGHLRVASRPGEGCTFFVELPRHQG
ncbi:MAG: ATP-binding protein [Acidobacteriota bacterium]|nr:ATP-binding protein [Acidobacteriota bacterium]